MMRILCAFIFFCVCMLGLELDEIKSKIMHSNVSGEFRQEKKMSNFPDAIKTRGKFSITNQVLLWETEFPIRNHIKITSDGIYVLAPDATWIKKSNQYDKQFFLSIVNLDFETLKQHFHIAAFGDMSNWKIILTPIGAILPKIFKDIQIYGDQQYVRKLVLSETSADMTTIYFLNIKTR